MAALSPMIADLLQSALGGGSLPTPVPPGGNPWQQQQPQHPFDAGAGRGSLPTPVPPGGNPWQQQGGSNLGGGGDQPQTGQNPPNPYATRGFSDLRAPYPGDGSGGAPYGAGLPSTAPLGMVPQAQADNTPFVGPLGMPTAAAASSTPFVGPLGRVAGVNAPSISSAASTYGDVLQRAYQPMFDTQRQQLAAKEAAMGILDSGGARKDFSDLGAQQSAILANNELPLLQQGFAQDYSARSQNAGAENSQLSQLEQEAQQAASQGSAQRQQANLTNAGAKNSYLSQLQQEAQQAAGQGSAQRQQTNLSNAGSQDAYLSQLTGLGERLGEFNASNDLQSQEFNQNLLSQFGLANMGANNNLQLAQLGYGNRDYGQMLSTMGNLEGIGLGDLGSILGQGMGNQWSGFMAGQNMGYNAGQGAGYGAGYGAGGGGGASAVPGALGGSGYDYGNGTGSYNVPSDPYAGDPYTIGSTPLPTETYTPPPIDYGSYGISGGGP